MALYDIDDIMKQSVVPVTPPSGIPHIGSSPPITPISDPREADSSVSKAIGTVGSPLSIFPGLYKGVKYGIPGMIADSAQLLGMESAKGVSEWAKEGLDTGEDKTWTEQAGEMIPMSGGVQILATMIGRGLMLAPHPVAKAVGFAISKAAPHITPILFGLSAGQGTKEAIDEQKAKGIDINDPNTAISKVVAIEWLGETVGNMVLAKALGPLAIGRKVTKDIASKMGIAALIKGSAGDFLRRFGAVVLPTEVATEMGQNYAQAVVEKEAGIRPEAQPGLEALSAVGPTTIMTTVMSAFGLAAHKHMANKQAEFLSKPVPSQLIREDSEKAEEWRNARFTVAKNVEDQIQDAELKAKWKAYSTDIISNNKSIKLDKPIEELMSPKVVAKPTAEVTPAAEVETASEMDFLMEIGTKIAKKKKVTPEEIQQLQAQTGKSDQYKRVADGYLETLVPGFVPGTIDTGPTPFGFGEKLDASGMESAVFEPTEADKPVAEYGGLSVRGKAEFDRLVGEQPAAEKAPEEIPEGEFTKHRDLGEIRKKLIVASRGTKEEPTPLITILAAEIKDYEQAAEMINSHKFDTGRVTAKGAPVYDTLSNQIIINKETRKQFEVIDYDTKMVGQGKGKKKKEVLTGLLVRPKLELPESISLGKPFRGKKVEMGEVEKIIQDSRDKMANISYLRKETREVKNELTIPNIITETAEGSGEFTYPKTPDELISIIAQKKAAGVDTSNVLKELSKTEGDRTPATYMPKILKAIKKVVDKKISEAKVKKAAAEFKDRPARAFPPTKPLTDIQKAINEGAGFVISESEEGVEAVGNTINEKFVPTVHDTATAAENRAKELNEKFGLKVGEKFQKNKPVIYFADTVEIDSQDKNGKPIKIEKFVVKKHTQVWFENRVAAGEKGAVKDPLLLRAQQLFDTKIAESELNSIEFIHDVMLPFLKTKMGESGASTAGGSKKIVLPPKFNLQPSDEVAEYLGAGFTPLPLAGRKLLLYGRLWTRLNEAMDRNYSIVGGETVFSRDKAGKLTTVKASEAKDVLLPVDQLTMIDPSGIPYLKRAEILGILEEIVRTETGWEGLKKFDAAHAAPGGKKAKESMLGLDIRKAKDLELARSQAESESIALEIQKARTEKIKREAKKKFGVEVKGRVGVSNVKIAQAKVREKKGEDVTTDREIVANIKNKTLKKLVAETLASNEFALKETVNLTVETPTVIGKVARMLTTFGKKTIQQWHDKAQADIEDSETDKGITHAMMERDFFSVNTEPSLMTPIDIVKLAAMHNFLISRNRNEINKLMVETGKTTTVIQEMTYQVMDHLGMSEEAEAVTPITTRKKEAKKEVDVTEMTLEDLIATAEPIPETMARATKAGIVETGVKLPKKKRAKKVSKAAEEKAVQTVEDILDLSEDRYEGFRETTELEDEANLYDSDPRNMAIGSMETVSEYVADTRPSSTFAEFKLSMYDFMGRVWDRVKHMARYLWDRIQYSRGDKTYTSMPRFMRVGGDGRRYLDRGDASDIESLWINKIKPDIKKKAQLARNRAERTKDPMDFQTADHYDAATNFNVFSNSKNKDYYNKIFDYVINKEWNMHKRVFGKIKSYLTQQKIAKLPEVRLNMPGVTKFLELGADNKYTVKSIRKLKAKIVKDFSPWMFNKPGEVAYRGAIKRMENLIASVRGDIMDGIQISEKWAVLNDNAKTQYVVRSLTPAYKAQINQKISNEIGVPFDVDVAVVNPDAFTKGVTVRLYNHPINPNSVIPTVDITTNWGRQYILRKIEGKWYSVFFHTEDLFSVATVEEMKAVDKADAEGTDLVTTVPRNLAIGWIGFQRLIQTLPEVDRQLAIDNYHTAQKYAKEHNIRSMSKDFSKNEVMRQLYGWFKSLGGKWRYEITDSRLSIKIPLKAVTENVYKLSDVFDIKHVTDLYDKAKTLEFRFVKYPGVAPGEKSYQRGEYRPDLNRITLKRGMSEEETLNILTHELQHFVQSIEGKTGPKSYSDMIPQYGNRLIDQYNYMLKSDLDPADKAWIVIKRNAVKYLIKNPNSKIWNDTVHAISVDLYRMETDEAESRISASRRKLTTEQLRKTPIKADILPKGVVTDQNEFDIQPASLSFLKLMIPTAAITQIDETGERFDIMFPEGYGIRVENMTVTQVAEEGAVGQWEINNGMGLMRIAGLTSPSINIYTEESPTTEQIITHELPHMIADIFMTNSEQAMMLSEFSVKGESEQATWERFAQFLNDPSMKPTPGQKTFIDKIRDYARKLLYWLKDLIYGTQVKSYKTPEALFAAIKSGDITRRPAQLNLTSPRTKGYISDMRRGSLPLITTSKGNRKVSDPNLAAKQRLISSQAARNFKLLGKLSHNPTVDGELPLSRTAMEAMSDFINDKQAAFDHNLGPQMKWYEHLFSNPLFKAGATVVDKSEESYQKMLRGEESTYGQRISKYPAWGGAVQIERERFHTNTNLGADFVQKTETYHRLKMPSMMKLDPLMEAGTTTYNRYFTESELRDPDFVKKVYESVKSKATTYDLSEDEIQGYLEATDYMQNVMQPALLKHAEETMIKPYVNALEPKEYAELQRLYKSLLAGHRPHMSNLEKTFNREEFFHTDPITKRKTNRLKKAYNNLEKKLIEIRRERTAIGFQKGYMPLRREPSSNYVSVKLVNEDGSMETIRNYSAFSDSHAARIANALIKEMPELKNKEKYEVRVGRSTRPTDSTFFMVGDMNTTRIIDLAIAKLTANQTLDFKDAETLSNSLYDSVADIMKARGAGMSAIHRKFAKFDGRLNNIEGYIKQDFRKIIDGYVYGYIGMQTKFKAATEYMELLKDVKASNPSMYSQVSTYAKNNLRNMDEWDRRIGKAKGFMFHFYLAGKISIMFLQVTQNFITAIPLMAVKMRAMGLKGGVTPERIMMGAMRDASFTSRLSAPEREMLEYFRKRGDTMAQYLRSIKVEALGSGSKLAARMLDKLAWPMKASEEWNREVAVLGYYRMLTQKAGYDAIKDKDKIYKEAEEFMYNTHWWYSKANLPVSAHGSTEFARMANLAYTFRPFTHHYALSLAYNFLNHGGTGGLLYAARSFAWLAIIGGVPAIPWIDDFIELVEGWTGIPIRMQMRRKIEKLAGKDASKFAGAGLFGLIDIDLSAALRPVEIPFVGDATQSVFGVYSGMYKKFDRFISELKIGEYTRAVEAASPTAAENLFKAWRLYEQGVLTTSKNPIYDERGKPAKLGSEGAILQAMGFKNLEYSIIMQDQWEKKVVVDHYNAEKSKITKRQHLAKTSKEIEQVILKMIDFNMSIPPYLVGIVAPIKWNDIVGPDKGMNRLRWAVGL